MIDLNTKLSDHFSLRELLMTEVRSLLDTNIEQGLEHMFILKVLCNTILEPIRQYFNAPMIITSGFRCGTLNYMVGGATDSQHCLGQAADFHVEGYTLEEVFEWIYKKSDLPYGQVILEGWVENQPSWIHVSLGEPFRDISRCREALTMAAGKYVCINK